ncbi:MAG: oxidoreductase-like domain-containing protein [Burkholderiales bacterium]
MAARGVALREPPPAPTICCGRGCYDCVWRDYYAALNSWRQEVRHVLGDDVSVR